MVGFPVEYIYTAVLRALSIDDLEIEFTEEFWLLYLLSVEFLRSNKIYKIFMIYIYFHLVLGPVEVGFPFFKWFNNSY